MRLWPKKFEFGPRQLALLKALRSGEYKQCFGSMRVSKDGDTCYCAVGVAADVSGIGEWKKRFDDEFGKSYGYMIPGSGVHAVNLPVPVSEYFGMYYGVNLLTLNDAWRLSLSEIADRMEKHPEDFFAETK